jgi:hypothetical protein
MGKPDRRTPTAPRSPTVTEVRTRCIGARGTRALTNPTDAGASSGQVHVARANDLVARGSPPPPAGCRRDADAQHFRALDPSGRGAGTGSQTGSHSPCSEADAGGPPWKPKVTRKRSQLQVLYRPQEKRSRRGCGLPLKILWSPTVATAARADAIESIPAFSVTCRRPIPLPQPTASGAAPADPCPAPSERRNTEVGALPGSDDSRWLWSDSERSRPVAASVLTPGAVATACEGAGGSR